jgi:predicted nucleotidyltransferase
MDIAGIICEYNPIHTGHIHHIAETRGMLGADAGIICVMSGNFVQRGETAVFEKHARAAAAVLCGADLVLELPLPYVLSSAEGFARGGVRLLNALGVVTHLSFGSEAGEIEPLQAVADSLLTSETDEIIKRELRSGVSYAAARERATRKLLGDKADVLTAPNNILGIEYLKALYESGSAMTPVTVRRSGAGHDGVGAESSSHLRQLLKEGSQPWAFIPPQAREVYQAEADAGRGPVFLEAIEQAILSRLRMLPDEAYTRLPDATEGLGGRLRRYAASCPDISSILEGTKTKRYALSRIRRMLMCAALGINGEDTLVPPPYIRVVAANKKGRQLIKRIKERTALPVVTKPAAAKAGFAGSQNDAALKMLMLEAAATDLYVLAYPDAQNRRGGQEWTISPCML